MQIPIVLVFAGNDPSGGAGLCADIQTLSSIGCHAAPVATCFTVQDTCNVIENFHLSGDQVIAQAEAVLNDMSIAVCKIGLLPSVEIVEAVAQILHKFPQMKVVFDPVLAAGGGKSLLKNSVYQLIRKKLLALTTVITPNSIEARRLTNIDCLNLAAAQLIDYGCQSVCITGTHENTDTVINTLYTKNEKPQSWQWQRLAYSYHGSGCTFASSLAGFLAQGSDMLDAVYKAQAYTWHSLNNGFHSGKGQALPNRLINSCNFPHADFTQ
jgi:hydroxymethylpyrimidine/phosphomethylpyrimidine kinase